MKKFQTTIISCVLTASIVGGGVYYWQSTQEIENQETIEQVKFYEDEYLSFNYPADVELLIEKPMGGRSDSQTIEFLVPESENETLESTKLRLSYVVSLGESENSAFQTLEDLRANYEEYDLETYEYEVDGREAVQIVTGDMTGETFFVVIPKDKEGDAFRFNGSFMNDRVKEILQLFVQTADLKQ